MSLLDLLSMFFFYTMVTFGNALVMFPILKQELVVNRHIISNEQLLYAFAVARVTPGLFNLYVTTIGYMMFGVVGAILSTISIAIPAFIVIPLHAIYNKVKNNSFVNHVVVGMTSVSVGLIFGAVADMGKLTLTGFIPVIVFITTLILSKFIKNTFVCLVVASCCGVLLKIVYSSHEF